MFVSLQFYLAVHSVELVVEGHGEVGGGAGGHMGDKGRLALVDRVVHVDATLADLHVLEARLHTARAESDGDREGMSIARKDRQSLFKMRILKTTTRTKGSRKARTVCCVENRGDATW